MRSMSHRAWRIRTKSRWRNAGRNWWLYVAIFGVLIWGGVEVFGRASGLLPSGLHWVPWLIFAAWWIPTSFGVSKWITGGVSYLFALPERLINPPDHPRSERAERLSARIRCPHCGIEVETDRAICSHCYQDLKTNCPSCGAILSISSKRCDQCGAPLPEPNEARR